MALHHDYRHIDYSRHGRKRSANGRESYTLKDYQKLVRRRQKLININHRLMDGYQNASQVNSSYIKGLTHPPVNHGFGKNMFSKVNQKKIARVRKALKKQMRKNAREVLRTDSQIRKMQAHLHLDLPTDPKTADEFFKREAYEWARDYKQAWDYHKKRVPMVSHPDQDRTNLMKRVFNYGRKARKQRSYYLDHPDKIGLHELINVPGLSRALGIDDSRAQDDLGHGWIPAQPKTAKFVEQQVAKNSHWPKFMKGGPRRDHFRKSIDKKFNKLSHPAYLDELKQSAKDTEYHYLHDNQKHTRAGYDNRRHLKDPYLGRRGYGKISRRVVMDRGNLREILGLRDTRQHVHDPEYLDQTVDNGKDTKKTEPWTRAEQLDIMPDKSNSAHASKTNQHPMKSLRTSDIIDMEVGKTQLAKDLHYQQVADKQYHDAMRDQAYNDYRTGKYYWNLLKKHSILKRNQAQPYRINEETNQARVDRATRLKVLKAQLKNVKQSKDKDKDKESKRLQTKIASVKKEQLSAVNRSSDEKMVWTSMQNAKDRYESLKKSNSPEISLTKMIRDDTDNQRVARYQKRIKLDQTLRDERLKRFKLQRQYKQLHPRQSEISGNPHDIRAADSEKKARLQVRVEMKRLDKQYKLNLKKKDKFKKLDNAFPSKKLNKDLRTEFMKDFFDENGNPKTNLSRAQIKRAERRFMDVTDDRLEHVYKTRNVPVRSMIKDQQHSKSNLVTPTMTKWQAALEILSPGITEVYHIGKDPQPQLDPLDTTDLLINEPSNMFEKAMVRRPNSGPGIVDSVKESIDRHFKEADGSQNSDKNPSSVKLGNKIGHDYFGSDRANNLFNNGPDSGDKGPDDGSSGPDL